VSSGLGSPDHPMRIVTRKAAGLAPGGWTPETRSLVSNVFDSLASEWHTRTSPQREAVVRDALERGIGVRPDGARGIAIEVGSGIGTHSDLLASWFDPVVAVDLAFEMLKLAPPAPGLRVRADSADLPVPDGSIDAVVLVNMFLFPAEVDRVLAPDGAVVWVNSSGEDTPIHLTPAEVASVLPGGWEGVEARAGLGIWCVLRRAGTPS
jgi:ubiquinone/menaquinone biosynthesis C-methylase UbiE